MLAKVVNVQLKTKDFKVMSHQRKLGEPTDSTIEIYTCAKELLQELHKNEWIRLVGVRVDGLIDKNEKQLSLFDETKNQKQEIIDKTVDDLKRKYGYEKVTRAGKM